MSDELAPALADEQWATFSKTHTVPLGLAANRLVPRIQFRAGRIRIVDGAGDAAAADPVPVIAVANAALPVNDPRKITREKLADLRTALELAGAAHGVTYEESARFLDALEGLLSTR